MSKKLRVVVATPMKDEDAAFIRDRVPEIELVKDDSLLPPMRWDADFSGDPSFTRTPEQQQAFEDLIDSADILYGIPDVKPTQLARTLRANPNLKWVQIMAAGGGGQVKAADLTRDELERVIFTTGAGVHAGPLAEFAIMGIFAGAKNLPRLAAHQAKKEWTGRWPMNQVSGSTVLVLGTGGIGLEVARKSHALGAHVIGVSRHGVDSPHLDEVIHPDALVATVPHVDAIVNTLPGTAATTKMLSSDVLAAVKPGVTICSVGRGTVIDEAALIDALRDGRVGFAALDVFAIEPLPEESPLWEMPNVVVSPHTAANSPAEEHLLAELFVDNMHRYLEGRELRNVVNTVEFY
ncbi:D-2-hydroxyacid dehydrogenase [Arcanobacterium haemolyticum]|nr:D-2-hydroxyacid dehydrogenase [Arcanobacterium haemolyticum]